MIIGVSRSVISDCLPLPHSTIEQASKKKVGSCRWRKLEEEEGWKIVFWIWNRYEYTATGGQFVRTHIISFASSIYMFNPKLHNFLHL